jgi:hypothetical protein
LWPASAGCDYSGQPGATDRRPGWLWTLFPASRIARAVITGPVPARLPSSWPGQVDKIGAKYPWLRMLAALVFIGGNDHVYWATRLAG